MKLSPDEMRRYSRHLSLPEVGHEGQLKLKSARMLVVGAGGLGAPVSMYLAAAGVGTLGLVDFDVVEESNLQRQVIFGTEHVGSYKVDVAAKRLQSLNPEIEIVKYQTKLTSTNALEILGEYDVIVDGTDNFPTRYLINDACVLLGKPNVYGSIFRFEGQATVFGLDGGPCYRCLYPTPPAPGSVPNCAEGGVLGVLPGIIGSIQANEALKIALEAGESLSGRIVLFDALKMIFRELRLNRDPACPLCGDKPIIKELIDYGAFCGTNTTEDPHTMISEINPKELKKKMDIGADIFVLDVREQHEFDICNISQNLMPMGEVPARMAELDAGKEIIVYCRTGHRSAAVVAFLKESGFDNVLNLRGGIHAWSDDIDPSFPKY